MQSTWFVLLSLLTTTFCALATPSWVQTGLTQSGRLLTDSGQLQLISNQNTTGDEVVSLTFNTAFVDNVPRCIISLANLQVVSLPNVSYYVDTEIDDYYLTGIDIYYQVGGGASTNSLRIFYLAIDSSFSILNTNSNLGMDNYSPLSNGSTGPRSTSQLLNSPTNHNSVIALHHDQTHFLAWINSFSATVDPQLLNLTITAKILNSTTYSVTLGTSHTNQIHWLMYSYMLFDRTVLEAGGVVFVDVGVVKAADSRYEDLTVGMVWKSNEGFFAGVSSLVVVVDDALVPAIGFEIGWMVFEVIGEMRFVGMEVGYWNARALVCPVGYPYYSKTTNLCYTSCPVPDMFWLVNSSTCIPCYYRCLTCSGVDPTICLTCNASKQRYISGDTCLCNPGYYEAGLSDCQPCDPRCQNCTSATVCTSCLESTGRFLSYGSCNCMDQYLQLNGVCVLCSSLIPGCLYCSDPATCSQCDPTLQAMLTQGSTCQCPSGLFLSPTGCDVCASFLPGCISCSSDTVCTECSTGNYFELGEGASSCNCQVGYFLEGSLCVKCPIGCTECSSGVVCRVCDTSNGFGLTGSSCGCDPTELAMGQTCIPCSSLIVGCSECTSTTTCTKCLATPNLKKSLSPPICKCSTDYSFNLTTQTCENCPDTCCGVIAQYASGSSCVACSLTLPNCLECTSGTSCLVCEPGYAVDGNVCTACSVGCLFCTSPAVCVACDVVKHFFLLGEVCVCEFGYVFDGAGMECVACSGVIDGCAMCNDTMNCFTCYPGMVFINNSYVDALNFATAAALVVGITSSAYSYCTCPQGFFMNGTTCSLCSKALPGCISCLTNTSCDSCTPSFTLSNGTCTCPPSTSLSSPSSICLLCSSNLPGCTTCSSPTACTLCTYGYLLTSSSRCECPAGQLDIDGECMPACSAGQYYNGVDCVGCDANCVGGCVNQSFTCVGCGGGLGLWMGRCECAVGMFWGGNDVCQYCSWECRTCTLSSKICLTCNLPMVIYGSTCVCGPQYFLDEGCTPCNPNCFNCSTSQLTCTSCHPLTYLQPTNSTCQPCHPACSDCFGPTASDCSSCTAPYTNTSGTCTCGPALQYVDASGICRSCHYTCLVCADSVKCLACDSGLYRELSIDGCPCVLPWMDARVAMCVDPCPDGFGSNRTNVCDEVCGDGRLFEKECDDANTEGGDGCDSACRVEQNYVCVNGTTTTPSVCSLKTPPSMRLVQIYKDPMKNKVTFLIAFQPAYQTLYTISNFSQVLTCNLPDTNLTFTYPQNGQLTILAQYSTNLQSLNATFTFNPSVIGGAFFATNPTSITFPLQSSNNLAVDYYDESTYQQSVVFGYVCYAVLGLGLTSFAVSLFAGRFIGVEMIGVVQAAFVGLMGMLWLPPLMAKLAQLQFANGLNTYFYDFKDGLVSSGDLVKGLVPPWISTLNYESEMPYSMNYSIILLLLPPTAALILFVASKIACKKSGSQKLERWSWAALCDFGLTATVFVLYHVIVSMAVFAKYTTTKSQLFKFSIVESILVVILSIPCLVLFKTHPQHFGAYKVAFKPDTLSQFHYWLLVSTRILLAVLLVAVNTMQYVCFICMAIPVTCLIYLAIRRPYLHLYNNIRAILNELFLASILAIYGYFRISHSQSTHSQILPIIVIVLLILTIILNLLAMIKYKHDQKSQRQTRQQLALMKAVQEIVNNEQTQFMQRTNGRWNAGSRGSRGLISLREMVKGKKFDETVENRLLETSRFDTGRLLTSRKRNVLVMHTPVRENDGI